MNNDRVYIAGHSGLVGSALVRRLQSATDSKLIVRSRRELDLTDGSAVERFFATERPTQVYLAAARVGGILDNDIRPVDFIRDNLLIEANVIHAAWLHGVKKLMFLGSSCIYPRLAPQPMRPSNLLCGPLEPTNQAYAIAKIAGVELCRAYRRQYGFNAITVMPTNLYGPGDRFDPLHSHVLPSLMLRFDETLRQGQRKITVWGTGRPRREFLYVDDLADALVTVMDRYDGEIPINIGCGEDISIAEIARLLAKVTGFTGDIIFDPSKPDGAPQKLLDVGPLFAMGWRPSITLEDGLTRTWQWFCEHRAALRS